MEELIYGRPRRSQPRLHLSFSAETLQDAFDVERSVLNIVQLLFVLTIAVLLVGILVR